jgi:hypothetical protein
MMVMKEEQVKTRKQSISKEEQQKLPKKYWLVEFTLTSGEILQFYTWARNQHEAYQKADEYQSLVEVESLKKKYLVGFKLLH